MINLILIVFSFDASLIFVLKLYLQVVWKFRIFIFNKQKENDDKNDNNFNCYT